MLRTSTKYYKHGSTSILSSAQPRTGLISNRDLVHASAGLLGCPLISSGVSSPCAPVSGSLLPQRILPRRSELQQRRLRRNRWHPWGGYRPALFAELQHAPTARCAELPSLRGFAGAHQSLAVNRQRRPEFSAQLALTVAVLHPVLLSTPGSYAETPWALHIAPEIRLLVRPSRVSALARLHLCKG